MNRILKNTLILTAITVVSGLLLGFVYELTKEPIARQEELAKTEAYAEVFPDADSFRELEDLEGAAVYLASTEYSTVEINEVAEACDASGNVLGHVFNLTTPEGYGGDIQLAVGVQSDGTLNGFDALSISETAGLGMNATQDDFRNQFAGVKADQLEVVKDGSGASDDAKIDAISGATITSSAITGAVNTCLAYTAEGGK